jgi:hypothetical protein
MSDKERLDALKRAHLEQLLVASRAKRGMVNREYAALLEEWAREVGGTWPGDVE